MASQTQRKSNSERNTGRLRVAASSPILWALLVLWTLAIVYGSLWPWQAWRDIGTPPWSFLSDPLPRHWTWFDLFSNVALYLPLGLLLALNLSHWRWSSLWVPLIAGALLSLSIEAAQSYLPQRVPSLLDLAANTLGAFCGSMLAAGLRRPWRLIRRLSHHWWYEKAQWPAVLVIIWLSIRIISLVHSHQTALGLPGHLPLGPESLTAGLDHGAGAGWLFLESLLLSLLLAQICRKPAVFWFGLLSSQALLLAGFFHPWIQAAPPNRPWLGVFPIAFWLGMMVGWALLHRRLRSNASHWSGFMLASLWALRSLLVLVLASFAADVEQSSLGPGLGPWPTRESGFGASILAAQKGWFALLDLWRSRLSPFGQALFDSWFGLLQPDSLAMSTTPILGRSLQHFEAVVLLVQALWRWLCLIWFLVLSAQPKAKRRRPQRRL